MRINLWLIINHSEQLSQRPKMNSSFMVQMIFLNHQIALRP